MLERIETKQGVKLWVRTGPYFGRREIARLEFEKWELRREKRDDRG